MRKLISIFSVLFISNLSLVFSYSNKGAETIVEDDIINSIPLFVKTVGVFPVHYHIHEYYTKGIRINEKKNSLVTDQIMTKGKMNQAILAGFLLRHNSKLAQDEARKLAGIYIEEAKLEGVNHDIAFSQMCLETGFLKYGGAVSKKQNNFCGLGTVNDQIPGETFVSTELGVRAHIQHLKAYATTESLKLDAVDKRFRFVKRGSAPTVNKLTGKWATDPDYGKKINGLLSRLYSI